MNYEANWESLDKRPIPKWFDNSKFGIFIHWGVYSVPAYAPKRNDVNLTGEAYAEWYGTFYKQEGGKVNEFHRKHYGENFKYEDFAPMFKAELFDADRWADLIKRSGAQYITITSKHHDGFCLWPSKYAWNWNSYDIGPHRDILAELKSAVEKVNVRFGLYYSLYEWDRPLIKEDPEKYALEHMIPQMKEVIERYEPYTFFTDGEWDFHSSILHSEEFLKWLFNHSKVKDKVVVNDRWGSETRSLHGGYFTTEYGEVYGDKKLGTTVLRKWEENRGIGASFGFNRNEDLEDYLSSKDCIHLLIDTVSKGGNLNLNIGPCADGTIPVIMQERLLQIGDWLKVNGEAIYETQMFRIQSQGAIKYTAKDDSVYAVFCEIPERKVILNHLLSQGDISAEILGSDYKIKVEKAENGILFDFGDIDFAKLPTLDAFTVKLKGVK